MLNNDDRNNDFVDHMMSSTFLDEALQYIKDNLHPDDVFDHKQLSQWAWDNDFKKFE